MNKLDTSYSFINPKPDLFVYEFQDRDTKRRVVFELSAVNIDVAVIQFMDNEKTQKVIPTPQGFWLRTSPGFVRIPPKFDAFFVTWTNNYELLFGDRIIWKLESTRQQTYSCCENITQVNK